MSLSRATPLASLDHMLDLVDLVLVMSVNPGFATKLYRNWKDFELRQLIVRRAATSLEVDGGVNHQTAAQVIAAGANVLVAGTATFKGGPSLYAENIAALREARQT